jgi:signal transduction histidine kinase
MATSSKLTPEILVPRLGEYLVQAGKISEADLKQALAFQQEMLADGKSVMLGQALVELKLLAKEELDSAVTEQIIQLRSALQDANRNLENRVHERTAELQTALQRLSELNQLKANFVANISHELRTPLTHIKGYLELLITDSLGSLSNEQKHALKVSQKSASKLERLIDDLIMFSLASRGELSIHLMPTDVTFIVNNVVRSMESRADEKGVSLHTLYDEHIPLVQADVQKISWAVAHLVDNGIKFTPQGGRVGINVRIEDSRLISLTVADTGIGIPQERLPEIFEPFHQLDSSTTRRYGGTGLGLSLVQQIIEAHGSRITVKSTLGKGTVFQFALPVSSAPDGADQ